MKNLSILMLLLLQFMNSESRAQVQANLLGQTNGFIPTAFAYLLIAPDAKSNGIGNAMAATSADVNSLHGNASKLAFFDSDFGISLSYMPWLRQEVGDLNYSYVSAIFKVDSIQKIGASLKYFSLGDIYSSVSGIPVIHSMEQYSMDLNYIRKLSLQSSGAIAFRYIYSDPIIFYGHTSAAINNYSIDLSFYHFNFVRSFSLPAQISYGIALTNIGPDQLCSWLQFIQISFFC